MKSFLRKFGNILKSYYPQIIFFLITISLALIILIILKYNFNLLSVKDYTSSSYLLSAIVQSLAAMLAIVLTLTMVSIQLAAQFLSYRIIKIYFSQLIPILMFLIYTLSILFNTLLLSKNNPINFGRYVLQINVALMLFFGCILYLVPYVLYLVRLLEPLNMTEVFMKKVDRKDVIDYPEIVVWGKKLGEFVELPRMSYNEDPLLPVFDILDLSLRKKTPDTIRGIIMSFRKRILQMLDKCNDEEESFKIVFYFCKHLKGIKEKIFKEFVDESIAVEILDSLCEVIRNNTLKILPNPANLAISSLRDISKSFLKEFELDEAVSFSTPWHLIPILLESPNNRRLFRVKGNIIKLIAELDYITDGNFLAKEVFLTHESEIAKTKQEKENVKYYRLKFEKQLSILKKQRGK